MNQTSLNVQTPPIMPPVKLLTTVEVAERLGLHRSRIHKLIVDGRLPAQMYGGVYLIREVDLKLIEDRKPGRPPKAKKR